MKCANSEQNPKSAQRSLTLAYFSSLPLVNLVDWLTFQERLSFPRSGVTVSHPPGKEAFRRRGTASSILISLTQPPTRWREVSSDTAGGPEEVLSHIER